jgi:glyceraldehyde 3-phosphate dehydrogenase
VTRIAVNGLGRIGRSFVKLAIARPELDVVAVNDLANPANLVYLMRFDSVYGRYASSVTYDPGGEPSLVIGDRRVRFFSEGDASTLPWGKLDIDIVVESTGAFPTYEQARAHLRAGARRVVLSAPARR